jgi:hypothetical protein
MIDWYIEISEGAPEGFKKDEYLASVIDISSPCMDYFCNRLTEMSNWKMEDALGIFQDIIDELPVMSPVIWNNEFFIRYNRWVYIRLTETPTQIYRESKIKQLLT